MKSITYTDKNGRKRISISMTEKEALKIYNDLLCRDSYESHKLKQIIFEFDMSDDAIRTGDCKTQRTEGEE